jgi:hypothetical protein
VSEAISLQRFLNGLDALLASLGEQRLRSAVRVYARGLPAGARTGFLEDLTGACAPAEAVAGDDTELIAAVEAFTADAASGMYYEGWGWDPEVRRERAFGDESWAPRMRPRMSLIGCVTSFGRPIPTSPSIHTAATNIGRR